MTYHPSIVDDLLGASRTIGADALFLRMVEFVARKKHGKGCLEPAVRERVAALQEQFADDCARVLERHLALRSLAALASEPVQRFLEARFTMAPALAGHLKALRTEIAELEL
jgi:hypothetical protein